MLAPERIWWKPLGRLERNWLIIAFVLCLFLTLMMPLWFFLGRQNVPARTLRVTPAAFQAQVNAFAEQYKIGEENGVPIVAPPPGSDVYILARQWQWYPIVQLEKGQRYTLHLSSLDVQHGFSLQPVNLNLQVLPGYDYIAEITPTRAGEYSIICNEYCYIAHHVMAGKLIVTE